MTTRGFLRKQKQVSERDGRTRGALRSLILGTVLEALRETYGENYSDRCMQSSSAVVRLLKRCGIDGVLVQGKACFGHVIGTRLGWAQFGGQPERFHFWSMTRFGELIDLTVHQHHLAPGVEPGGSPCPALWWNDARGLPAAFQYLHDPPRGRIEVTLADRNDQEQFETFLTTADRLFEEMLECGRRPELPEVAATIDDLNRIAEAGDPWATMAWRFQELPLPSWAQRRRDELMAPYADGE